MKTGSLLRRLDNGAHRHRIHETERGDFHDNASIKRGGRIDLAAHKIAFFRAAETCVHARHDLLITSLCESVLPRDDRNGRRGERNKETFSFRLTL